MTRQVPIREWPCPHHDGPVTVGCRGCEGEPAHEAFPAVVELLDRVASAVAFAGFVSELGPIGEARIQLGLCCRDLDWKIVGYRDARPFEGLLYDMADAKFAAERERLGMVRIPLVTNRDPGDECAGKDCGCT